jgi:hypothetical protein
MSISLTPFVGAHAYRVEKRKKFGFKIVETKRYGPVQKYGTTLIPLTEQQIAKLPHNPVYFEYEDVIEEVRGAKAYNSFLNNDGKTYLYLLKAKVNTQLVYSTSKLF